MPALGMAQDTGKIVSWLKRAGDPVKAGDALMEVETDKAVMEVEAPADGFLTDVRAAAGEAIPVGQVIAVISDTADEPAPVGAAPRGERSIPDGQTVIMPALGMTQDTGKIVAWRKALGDSVSDDDVLFEVETDKATMEVAAGLHGFVAALLAEVGQDVPVGHVVAVISAERPEAPIHRAAGARPVDAVERGAIKPKSAPRAQAVSVASLQRTSAPTADSRILASPKVRRLALEQGLDLSLLVAKGHPQPFHVVDLQVLRDFPPQAAQLSAPRSDRRISARVPNAPVTAFMAWLRADGGTSTPAFLWAAFASSALRDVIEATSPITVHIMSPTGTVIQIVDADRIHPDDHPENDDSASPDLILRDLTATAITAISLGGSTAPILTLTNDGESHVITLEFTAYQLSDQAAIALISGFADRLSDPLRQLL